MLIDCVWEHHGNDSLLFASNVVGAFTRGASKEEAIEKMPGEIKAFLTWANEEVPSSVRVQIVQEKASELDIADADSNVIFDTEREDMTVETYERLKALALKSAKDFLMLYLAVPGKETSVLQPRKTFYGHRPCTASEMYLHTKNINAYYWGEVGVNVSNDGDILNNRLRGFEALEARGDYLSGKVYVGSDGEEWSVPKVLRRFLWHDRIHAKAMYRMGLKTFGENSVPNIFKF
jgi:hypothetical protein